VKSVSGEFSYGVSICPAFLPGPTGRELRGPLVWTVTENGDILPEYSENIVNQDKPRSQIVVWTSGSQTSMVRAPLTEALNTVTPCPSTKNVDFYPGGDYSSYLVQWIEGLCTWSHCDSLV